MNCPYCGKVIKASEEVTGPYRCWSCREILEDALVNEHLKEEKRSIKNEEAS